MGGKKKEKKRENCGNQVAENLGRNLIVIQAMKLPKMKRKKIMAIDLWQWNCRNGRKKNSSS